MKSLILFLTLSSTASFCFAQTDSSAAATGNSKNTFTLAAIYANDANYYGQKAAEATPYVAAAAVYQLKSGLYFTGQSYKLLNDNTSTVSAAALGAGIDFKMGKKLETDLSYSHSFYPSYSPLLQAANADNASLAFSLDSMWIKPKLTLDYAFGKTNDAFATAAISKSINLFSISPKDIVTIEPAASIIGGTQHFYQTYITQKKLHDSVFGVPLPGLGNSSGTSHADTTSTTDFNVLSYNFKIPLAYNRSHYLIQAEYQLSMLSNHVSANKQINSFLTFSFYYQF